MTTFTINVRQITALADSLGRVTGEALGRATLAGVNEVAQRAYVTITGGETEGINLSPVYVKSKTDLSIGSNPGDPRALLESKERLTPLGNFGPLTVRQGQGQLMRAGPRAGRRNAGVNLSVRLGQPLYEPQWFVLPLRSGRDAGGNGEGVFVRSSALAPSRTATREGRFGKRHIYGPSPNTLFAHQVKVQAEKIQTDLSNTVVASVLAELKGSLP